MVGQCGPEHVAVCALKHYCDCNAVCVFFMLETATTKGEYQHHTSLYVTDNVILHAVPCGCYVRVCVRACVCMCVCMYLRT
jgi:hypothetical protein